jgi:hypothetical protein
MYKSLNDVYPKGNTKIWYATNPTFLPEVYKPITETHTLLGEVDMTDLDEIFYKMQGEIWSPEGEARELIIRKGLNHTSMSVGDVVEMDGELFVCDRVGWNKVL